MNVKFYVLAIIIMAFSLSCSSVNNTAVEEVVIDDGYKTTENDEVIIEDKDLKLVQEAIVTEKEGTQQNEIVSADGSRISVMVDGYGNKSESRHFTNHPRIQMILIRTAANGQKQVFVYAQNGEVKDLPANMLDNALVSTADELASAAGIYEGRKQKTLPPILTGLTKRATTETIPPVQNYQIPVENQEVENQQSDVRQETVVTQTEPIEKNDSNVETKPPQNENLQNFLPKKRRSE